MGNETWNDQDVPSPLLTKYTPMSVRGWLALLIFVAMIPAFAFSLAMVNRNNKELEGNLVSLAWVAAKAKSDAVDEQVGGLISSLKTLAASRSVQEDDLEQFRARALEGLAGSKTFLVAAKDLDTQAANTVKPIGEKLAPLRQRELYQRAIDTGQPQISGAIHGPSVPGWFYVVAYPMKQPTPQVAFLLMGQRVDALKDGFEADFREGRWQSTLVDRNGVVLASTRSPDDIGRPFFLPPASGRVTGVDRFDVDGKVYESVTQYSALTGWSVRMWADTDTLRAPVYRTYWTLIVGALAMTIAASLAAYLLGRQISASVRHLADDAAKLGRGEDVPARSSPVTELTQVSTALAAAAQRRRASESEIRFLLREVAHRSKNQLMVISSLAKQSAAGADSIDDFNESFQNRIHGLSRSTDLLLADSVSGTELHALVKAQVEPFRPAENSGLNVSGPDFRLSPQAMQMLGQVFHEMSTNAAKHGAYSAPGGRIDVCWSIDGEVLKLTWREHGVKPVSAPSKRGFGTRLLVRMIGSSLRGQVNTTYHPDGLEVLLELPLSAICHEGGAADSSAAAVKH